MDCDVPLFGYNLLQITEFLQIQIVMVTEYNPLLNGSYGYCNTLSPYKVTEWL
jgi:hypothetical protein